MRIQQKVASYEKNSQVENRVNWPSQRKQSSVFIS